MWAWLWGEIEWFFEMEAAGAYIIWLFLSGQLGG